VSDGENQKVPVLFIDGPKHGKTSQMVLRAPAKVPPQWLNVAPAMLFPTGRIRSGPRPPIWRFRHWNAWRPTEPAPPEPDLPPLRYGYAGTLDDGTLVYRFDADASYPQIGAIRD